MNDATKNIKDQLEQIWQLENLRNFANTPARIRSQSQNEWMPPMDIEPKREMLYLSVGIPDSIHLPREGLFQAMQGVLENEDDASLRYGFGQGYYPIRKYLAEKYTREKGMPVTEDWFQLTNGSSAAIDLIVRSMIEPGDVIITESPTYMGSLANFIGVGAEICPVSMDEEGLDMSELASKIETLKAQNKKVKLIYTISAFQNPSGGSMSHQRKSELLQLSAREKVLILDDIAYGDLYYESKPEEALSAMSGGYGVLTVGTLSKIIATGLRVGWIHANPDAINLFGRMRFDMGQNQMALRMVGSFLEQGLLEPHGDMVRTLYKKKMTFIADALNHRLADFVSFDRPKGGFYLWAKLADGLKAKEVWRTATHEGIAVNPGYMFFPDQTEPHPEFLRIAYSWTPMEQLEEAVNRLATACQRVADGDAA